jgi:glutamate synthase (NADPH) large chain
VAQGAQTRMSQPKSPFLTGYPRAIGLYDPDFEHDSCGVGFVAHVKGLRSHSIVQDARTMLCRMDHRGACGSDARTGDGAGVLTSIPLEMFQQIAAEQFQFFDVTHDNFAAGNFFLPHDLHARRECQLAVDGLAREFDLRVIGWRDMDVSFDRADVGPGAREVAPYFSQLLVTGKSGDSDALERNLFRVRKRASHLLRTPERLNKGWMFYCCSLSSRIIVYKGMLTPSQLFQFYADLSDQRYKTHLAMVHSRFSTNTFPSWDRAQPNRWMSHNGEINTVRGNMNWMRAREKMAKSSALGDSIQQLLPVVETEVSDSGVFDNVLEFLMMGGRTLQESVMMMIPEAWQKHPLMTDSRRAFYEYHATLMEPWDGPASITFTDGRTIGAILDRNGLRPSRYYLTQDDRVIMASEVGVLDVPPELVREKGRLQAGCMFLVDFAEGRIVPDDEIKERFAAERPYREWLTKHRIELDALQPHKKPHGFEPKTLLARMQAFGYSVETGQFMLFPLIREKRDPLGSMGNDAALACMSDQPRILYDYFRQLFAQVTNPAIDSIREEVVMSLQCYIGPEGNLLEPEDSDCRRLLIPHPILSNEELMALRTIDYRGWRCHTIDITFPLSEGKSGLVPALERICQEAVHAIEDGNSLLVLSDRSIGPKRVPVSALLACGAVHHRLVQLGQRTQIGIVLETGEAREVHHHCVLVGYGADAINPYLAFEALWQARRQNVIQDESLPDDASIVEAYRKGTAKGMLKVMAKMGISTLQSYKGAQIFEAVGLHQDVIQRCFAGTPSRLQGMDFEGLAEEAIRRHALGYPNHLEDRLPVLPNFGEYHWRPNGERHAWNPGSIADLQLAARSNSAEAYERYAQFMNSDISTRCSVRRMIDFQPLPGSTPVPLEEVEPAKEIVRRFCTGAMSFGSISSEAHETLALAMNRIQGKSNTGEGGEDSIRFQPLPDGSSKRSAIKQVASGRFGVTINYLTNADELQIKIAQGAKPGEGGELPGRKVDANIARIRFSTPGVGLISPPPHHDIYSIEDLKQLIFDLKNSNPSARISVKLVSEVGVGTIAAGVAKGHADHIVIAGDVGGTGASPLTSIKHAGLPWELGLAETHQTLVMNDLRSRVVLQTDGGLRTGRDVVIAAMLGAEEMGFATAPLIALGCIMMRKCHLNTCPVGIATQDPKLREKFAGLPEHVINYMFLVAEDVRKILARLGFRSLQEVIGRADCLAPIAKTGHWKLDRMDVSRLLVPAATLRPGASMVRVLSQDHGIDEVLDHKLIAASRPAIDHGVDVKQDTLIANTDRAVGTMLSHEIARSHGEAGLPDGRIHFRFRGSAGQSFGAFLASGITLELEGDANDYVGKGLSGGRIVIYPPRGSVFLPEDNILVGNVVLYGAIRGEAYFRGRAAERFCVRNSGAIVVVEGVGDHGCEYMTGGRTVILGPTGSNFAAGMSGGIAYVLQRIDNLARKCNHEMVDLEFIESDDESNEVRRMIERHYQFTGSTVAEQVLEKWNVAVEKFVKVMPQDYRRALEERFVASEETS